MFFAHTWGTCQATQVSFGKGSLSQLYCQPSPVFGKEDSLAPAFLLACVCGCVFHFSTRMCAHDVGQWRLGVALFAWKCQLGWVVSWQENRDVRLRRLWKEKDLRLGPWGIVKSRGREFFFFLISSHPLFFHSRNFFSSGMCGFIYFIFYFWMIFIFSIIVAL